MKTLWRHAFFDLIPFRMHFGRPGLPMSQHATDTKIVVEAAHSIAATAASWNPTEGFGIDHERRAAYELMLETTAGWHTAHFFRIKIPLEEQRRAKFEKRFLVYVFKDSFWTRARYNLRSTRHITGGGWFVDFSALSRLKRLIREDRLKWV